MTVDDAIELKFNLVYEKPNVLVTYSCEVTDKYTYDYIFYIYKHLSIERIGEKGYYSSLLSNSFNFKEKEEEITFLEKL